jgi:hypothetical protein
MVETLLGGSRFELRGSFAADAVIGAKQIAVNEDHPGWVI